MANPEIGTIRLGREIGRKPGHWIWVKCHDCPYERWAEWSTTRSQSYRLCRSCSIKNAKRSFSLQREQNPNG